MTIQPEDEIVTIALKSYWRQTYGYSLPDNGSVYSWNRAGMAAALNAVQVAETERLVTVVENTARLETEAERLKAALVDAVVSGVESNNKNLSRIQDIQSLLTYWSEVLSAS